MKASIRTDKESLVSTASICGLFLKNNNGPHDAVQRLSCPLLRAAFMAMSLRPANFPKMKRKENYEKAFPKGNMKSFFILNFLLFHQGMLALCRRRMVPWARFDPPSLFLRLFLSLDDGFINPCRHH